MRRETRVRLADSFHPLTLAALIILTLTLVLQACQARDPQPRAEGSGANEAPGIVESVQSPGVDGLATEEGRGDEVEPSVARVDWSDFVGVTIVRANGNVEVTSTAEFEERPTLFVYWGIWCHTCHEELAALSEWYSEGRAQRLRIVTVHNDGPTFHERATEEALKAEWPFDTLLPTSDQLTRWNPRSLTPTTALIAVDGTETARVIGFGSSERGELFDLLSRFE